jgi:hypothetical protein
MRQTMPRSRLSGLILGAALLLGGCSGPSHAAPPTLALKQTLPLPGVKGRIDHLAIDRVHRRLFVAEIANGSVDVLDLDSGAVIGHLDGLKEPQGLAYLPDRNVLVVACGGEGAVRFYDLAGFALLKTVGGLDDADNVRLDPVTGDVVVGYGAGGLAIIDPVKQAVVRTIALPAHPEGFQIDAQSHRAYVNLPRALRIAVADLASGRVSGGWGTTQALENFPMALDPKARVIASGFRLPGRFVAYDPEGKVLANLPGCGTTDDLFFDAARQRFYMLCADGHIDVFAGAPGALRRVDEVTSRSGGRTGLFDADSGTLYVAASASADKPAAVLVFR